VNRNTYVVKLGKMEKALELLETIGGCEIWNLVNAG
jgi:hypothetical protein